MTAKNTVGAIYVNTENLHYLLIEDAFPNGHPPLEQCGVILTRRDIVEKSAQMKVSTCMNPMDTALGVYGCMLGYTQISAMMKDPEIVTLITRMSEQEAMPMVADPGVIDPVEFLHEVLGERYPNPFLQDPRSASRPIPRVRSRCASARRCTLTTTPRCPRTVRPSWSISRWCLPAGCAIWSVWTTAAMPLSSARTRIWIMSVR